jgi:hypothetical protein
MKKNIGSADAIIRIIVGLFLLSLIFWGPKTWWGLIGLIPIVTVFIGYCPPYALLGISTRKEGPKPQ